jgi:LCP family protein required for cell wall assembly
MVVSGGVLVSTQALLARYEGSVGTGDLFGDAANAGPPPPVSDLKGPLNILLVGIDPRASEPNKLPLADSIMILHVPAGLDRAYLFSMPRDLRVEIPAFPKADYRGGRERINAAMAFGSHVPGQVKPDPARGFELLATTLTKYTGIERFDAGAIINFGGFKKIVDAMGGVDMHVDVRTLSEHLRPDGSARTLKPGGGGYLGPQKVYEKGNHHLTGWEALDYVRQRKSLPDGDYGRQRHQQQFVKAIANQAFSADVVTNPIKLDRVLRAAGQSLIFNGRGHSVVDFALALRHLRSESILMIKLPGRGVTVNGQYQGEQFDRVAHDFFAAVRADQVDAFIVNHPALLRR